MSDLNCVQRLLDHPVSGVKWDSARHFLAAHRLFFRQHLDVINAHVGCCGGRLPPDMITAVCIAVNSSRECVYCDGVFMSLARIAGVSGVEELRCAKNSAQSKAAVDPKFAIAVEYAQEFGATFGVGPQLGDVYEKMENELGAKQASSVKAIATFLYWTATTGNSVNDAKRHLLGIEPVCNVSMLSIFVFLYYGPLFFIAFCMRHVLGALPDMKEQTWFFRLIGTMQWCATTIFLVPLGIIAYLSPCCMPAPPILPDPGFLC